MIPLDIPPPFDAAWFQFLIGGVIGAALGSFGTMLAYRLPRKISILFPGSRCPSCTHPLGIRDLVPLLSWLFSKGRCRYCYSKIGVRYFGIEITTTLACGAATVVLGCTPILIGVYASIVAIVVAINIKYST